MDLTRMEKLLKHINFYDTSFLIAVMAIVFNPLFWNVVRIAFHCIMVIVLFGEESFLLLFDDAMYFFHTHKKKSRT